MEQQNENKRLAYIEKKIDEFTFRLFGNKKLDRNDEGVIGDILEDIQQLKDNQFEMKQEFQKQEKTQIKYNVQTAIMWASLGGTAALILAYLISKIHP